MAMPSPAQMVQRLSETTGVSLATITDFDRRLVKQGLRSKGGRGLQVARVTPLDAARLLTAILGSAQANVAARAVDRYTGTQVDLDRSSENLFAASGLADLASVPARHSFVDGLEHLIASAATGALAQLIEKTKKQFAPPAIEVFALNQATFGRIRLAGLPNGMVVNLEYVPVSDSEGPHLEINGRGIAGVSEISGDLEQSRRVTGRTILPLAKLFAEERENGSA
jgi:hypothetical protein